MTGDGYPNDGGAPAPPRRAHAYPGTRAAGLSGRNRRTARSPGKGTPIGVGGGWNTDGATDSLLRSRSPTLALPGQRHRAGCRPPDPAGRNHAYDWRSGSADLAIDGFTHDLVVAAGGGPAGIRVPGTSSARSGIYLGSGSEATTLEGFFFSSLMNGVRAVVPRRPRLALKHRSGDV